MTTKKKPRKAGKGKPPAKVIADEIFAAERRRAEHNARLVKSLFDSESLPEFITDAVMTGLHLAKDKTGIEFWQIEPDNIMGDDFDLPGLAGLLRVAHHHRDIDVQMTLPELIAAVLAHPDVPTPVRNKLSEAVGELAVKDEVVHTPEVLRVALAVHKAETEAGE